MNNILSKIHQRRLAKLAIALLKHSRRDVIKINNRELRFDMSDYMGEEDGESVEVPCQHARATSCCFLGFAPMVFPHVVKNVTEWDTVVEYVIGRQKTDAELFLFGTSWSNIPKQAAARALTLLENGQVPDYTKLTFHDRLTNDEIIERLQKFL